MKTNYSNPIKKLTSISTIVISVILLTGFTYSESKTKSHNLFKIGRSRDANIIKYDVNLDDKGNLISEKPIKVYWVKNTDGGKIESLTYIQRTMAYGIKILENEKSQVKFQFISYNKRSFFLKKGSNNKYAVYTWLKDKWVIVKDIFIQIDGGTFMVPVISYVQMNWKDPKSSTIGTEIIKP